MKKNLRWLFSGLVLAVIGGVLAMSTSSLLFYTGLAVATVGVLIIIVISINYTGL